MTRRWTSALLLMLPMAVVAATLRQSVSTVDGKALLDNPGCGFADGWWVNLEPDCPTNGENLCATAANCMQFWSLHKFSKGYAYNGDYAYYTNHIVGLVGGADIPLTEKALLAVSNSFLKCRINGGTCIPHFAYTPDRWGGAEPDDFSMILTHIAQLGAVISQFGDVVPAVECGMIGAWGEMHTSRYTAEPYQSQIIGAWLANLPADMPLLVRSPPAWMRYLNTTTAQFFGGGMESMDQTLRARMGFFNHGYLGSDDDYGTWTKSNGGVEYSWTREQARTFLRGQTLPYGGELAYVSNEFFNANSHLLDPARHNILAEWYDTHLSYLRNIRSTGNTVYQKLSEVNFSQRLWAFEGMPDLSEYEGTDLRKFCEDHMGCRFVVRGVSFGGYPGRGLIDVEIENTGFGRLLFEDSMEIVLSGVGGTFSLPSRSGDQPSLRTIAGGSKAVLTLEFDYPESLAPGSYDVLLRAWAPLADERARRSVLPRRPIRFANEGAWDENLKANRLCDVSLSANLDVTRDALWFAWNAAYGRAFGGRLLADGQVGGHLSRNFAIDTGVPPGETGNMRIEMYADPMSEIPCPEGGVASFIFLDSGNGEPIPYGYCAEGWKRLWGCAPASGQRVVLRMRVSGRRVSYALDETELRDESGRTWLPAVARASTVSGISLVGTPSDLSSFFGTFLENAGSNFTVKIR